MKNCTKCIHNLVCDMKYLNLGPCELYEKPRPHGEWWPCTKEGLPLTDLQCRCEPKKWYGFKCSHCTFIYKGNALTQSPYCQKCGAIMESQQKTEGNEK